MRYARTVEIHCEGLCGRVDVIREGGETGHALAVTVAVQRLLGEGWVALTPRAIDGSFGTIRDAASLDLLPRGVVLACPQCDGKVIPPYSKAAQRALDEAEDEQRTLLIRIARLEDQVAALTGLREAVES